MKILKYSLLCFIVGIVSCNTNPDHKELDSDIPGLTGEWLMSSTYGAMCNVCPEIAFIDSRKGNILYPSKERYDFKYDIQKDKISFHFEKNQ